MNSTAKVHGSVDPFQALARLFRRDIDQGSAELRISRTASTLAVVLTLPLAAIGLVWLARATDWTIFGREWPMFLLLAALLAVLGQLQFYAIADLGGSGGTYGSAVSSLDGAVRWSGIFLFGPPVIWIDLLVSLLRIVANRAAWRSRDTRWGLAQNVSLGATVGTLLQLISLSAYHALGGEIPPPGLSFQAILPGLAAVTLQMLMALLLLWSVYLGYTTWALHKTLAKRLLASLPLLLFMNLVVPYLADLFGVPLAGIYVAHGLAFYLVFVLAVLLVGLMALQMSRANENSRVQSVQLDRLAALGRAILNGPPDASTLPEILTEHVPAMFTHARLGIWTGERTLLAVSNDWPAAEQETIRAWACCQEKAQGFTARELLPWDSRRSHRPAITSPILEVDTGKPSGGIYVELVDLVQAWNRRTLQRLLPSLEGLAAQIASALHQARVYQETLAHQRTQQELDIARQIQASFLPRELPQIPGWEISASLEPAREMAGDFYDLMALPGGRLGILIADVADKGMGPALYMALSRTLIRTFAFQNVDSPEKVLQNANERIMRDADYRTFVTAFYGVLDPQSGEMKFANAGHNPPWLFDPAQPEPTRLTRTGMALGADETVKWTSASVRLSPGSTLLFYTDGATDAQNAAGELFEEQRLREAVKVHSMDPAETIRTEILAQIRDFVQDTPQFDDITLIVVRRTMP